MSKNRPEAHLLRESNILHDYHAHPAQRSSDGDTTGQRPPAIAANTKDGAPLSPNTHYQDCYLYNYTRPSIDIRLAQRHTRPVKGR